MNTTVSFASASDTREQKPQVRELAPGVYGYISDFDPNCGFVVGDEHVVLIDTRPTPRMARDFLAARVADGGDVIDVDAEAKLCRRGGGHAWASLRGCAREKRRAGPNRPATFER